jgi:hypothetical protein
MSEHLKNEEDVEMKRFFSVIMALAMCTAMATSAFAVNQETLGETRVTTDSRGNLVYIPSGMVDTLQGERSPTSMLTTARATSYLFTMTIDEVYEDLHTVGAESFTKASLDNSYVRAEGVIENDVNEYAQVGLCEYDDGFKAPQWTLRRVESNRFFSESWPVSSLDSHFTYYGWMQSHYLGNTFPYSGYVDYFDSTQS